jgi:hypothetical protein
MSIQIFRWRGHRTWPRFSLFGCLMVGLLVMGNAQAQWKVVDNELIQETKNAWKEDGKLQNKQIDKLADLYNQQKIGKYEAAGEIAKDPTEVLDADKPMGTLEDVGIDARCPATKATTSAGAAQTQWQICKLLVQTELAQYKYSLKMYETAKERHKQLEKIQKEREGLKEEDQGKLQDNNNKLLALIALMEVDRQQQKTYMDAYEARTRYLMAAQSNVSSRVLNGDPVKSIIGGAVGYATLELALKAAETSKKNWESERR